MLVEIILVILIVGISLLICARLWNLLREFFHKNYSFFEILFVLIYFFEQAGFILISYFYSPKNPLWIGMFALIVITTVSVEKVLMDSRNRKISKLLLEKNALFDVSIYEKDKILSEYNKLKKEYEELLKVNEKLIEDLIRCEEKSKKKR
jgi:hypothetical protein